MTFEEAAIYIVIGLAAGFINAIGGGGSIIVIPVLMSLGLEGALANGTARVALLAQGVFGTLGYARNAQVKWGKTFRISLLIVPFAVLGAILASNLEDKFYRPLVSILIVAFSIYSVLGQRKAAPQVLKGGKPVRWFAGTMLALIGFYSGFIQIGTGIIMLALLVKVLKFDYIEANAQKMPIQGLIIIPILITFAMHGKVDWAVGGTIAIGQGAGAFIGSLVAFKKGSNFVRKFLVVCAVALAINLMYKMYDGYVNADHEQGETEIQKP
ncbi:MAG: sulfite exporter TauE/SafE family protein [Planctomycetes bacterium]|nr:sulfite exporter TauE/SafE family protein [Planctomycetota bacterium]